MTNYLVSYFEEQVVPTNEPYGLSTETVVALYRSQMAFSSSQGTPTKTLMSLLFCFDFFFFFFHIIYLYPFDRLYVIS